MRSRSLTPVRDSFLSPAYRGRPDRVPFGALRASGMTVGWWARVARTTNPETNLGAGGWSTLDPMSRSHIEWEHDLLGHHHDVTRQTRGQALHSRVAHHRV